MIPAFTPGELYGAVPELADLCNLTTKKIFGVFSENMARPQYLVLAHAIEDEIVAGAGRDRDRPRHRHDGPHGRRAVVHGTGLPGADRAVGSQRSSDRPSSDAALNLIHAVRAAALGDIAEVQICMFGPTSDRYALLHRGTRCRKMHSSYRSTFRTVGDIPLAMVSANGYLTQDYLRRDSRREVRVDAVYEDRTTILYYWACSPT